MKEAINNGHNGHIYGVKKQETNDELNQTFPKTSITVHDKQESFDVPVVFFTARYRFSSKFTGRILFRRGVRVFLALLNRRSTILEFGGNQCSFIVFKAGTGSGERSTDFNVSIGMTGFLLGSEAPQVPLAYRLQFIVLSYQWFVDKTVLAIPYTHLPRSLCEHFSRDSSNLYILSCLVHLNISSPRGVMKRVTSHLA